MRAAFPQTQGYIDDKAENEMALIMETITAVRNIRGEMNIPPATKLHVTLQATEAATLKTVETHQDMVVHLARLDRLQVESQGDRSPTAATAIVADATLLVELKGVVDFSQEVQRLEKEMGKLNKELTGINKKLNNDSFLSKAPAEVVTEVKEKQQVLSEKQEKLAATLERIRAFAEK